MSVVIKRDELTEEKINLIRKFLFLQPKEKFNYGSHHSTPKSDPVLFYSVVEGHGGENYVFIPYRFSEVLLGENRNLSGSYTPSVFEFTGALRDYQAEDMPLALEMLEKHGTVSLGYYPGYGKTLISSYIASKYKLLTVVLMHRITFIKQWYKTFTKFTNARLWMVGEEEKPPIFNVIVCLDERVGKIPVEIRNRVGMMVIDEAHAFCTKKQAPRLLSFHPKYIIALSATLERDDGMHEMIYAMCGDHRITREMKKEFHVYKVDTGIKGIRKDRKGGKGVEWHPLAKSLAFNDERNRMIVAMALKNPTHKIVILTGYVSHTKLLHKTLSDLGESVDYLCGNKKNYKNSRVLIGTIDKIGTGFDEESFCDDFNGVKINLGILAHSIASKKLLEQSVGRVFRASFPNIFHLVDDDKTIQRHWTNAKRWYKSKGGILHN